jgi:hypothetical protein
MELPGLYHPMPFLRAPGLNFSGNFLKKRGFSNNDKKTRNISRLRQPMSVENLGHDPRFGQHVYFGWLYQGVFWRLTNCLSIAKFLSAGRKYPDAADRMIKAKILNEHSHSSCNGSNPF